MIPSWIFDAKILTKLYFSYGTKVWRIGADNQRILVTGGAGYIGGHKVKSLIEEAIKKCDIGTKVLSLVIIFLISGWL